MEKKYLQDESFNHLINNFMQINKMGFVKGINNNPINSVGLTFEHLLKKSPDSNYFPDYFDIEIKCKQRYSNYPIVLFSIAFDGPTLFETNYLREKYGTIINKLDKKELYANLKYKEKVMINDNFYFELDMDFEKIFINIYDNNETLIEKRGFLYFSTIMSHYELKMNKLAIIRASKRKIYKDLYFRYYKINCFYKKQFSNFIDAIKNNIIKIHLVETHSKSANNYGKNKSKGVSFEIYIDNIDSIFTPIYEFEDF